MTDLSLPRHIALILDGNGRWAAARNLPRLRGHEHGAQAVRAAVRGCRERGVKFLTLYAFSVANWSRPKEEIEGLMRLCTEFAERERPELIARGIAVQVIGDLDEIPTPTRRAVESLIADTAGGREMTLSLALSYGGRRDMVNAMRAIAVRARAGLVVPEDLDEDALRSFLTTSSLPDPDLVVRTGGERRISDFLLFECAYAELFFTETLWPDFTDATLGEAIAAYARRERRYGRTSEQVRTATV
jgi:undecaprenyl diphosphate synthase